MTFIRKICLPDLLQVLGYLYVDVFVLLCGNSDAGDFF